MTMAHLIHDFGGPDQLSWEAIEVPELEVDEVRLSQTAVGMNMMEIGCGPGPIPVHPRRSFLASVKHSKAIFTISDFSNSEVRRVAEEHGIKPPHPAAIGTD